MPYAVNTFPFPKVIVAPTVRYNFLASGYYIENAELTPFIASGELVRQSTVSASAVQATRVSTYTAYAASWTTMEL